MTELSPTAAVTSKCDWETASPRRLARAMCLRRRRREFCHSAAPPLCL